MLPFFVYIPLLPIFTKMRSFIMKNLFFFLCFMVVVACNDRQNANRYPVPTQIRDKQEEVEKERMYEQYLEASHGAGRYDWRAIEAENKRRNIAYKNALKKGITNREIFAGGQIEGTWHERGPNNQAGSVIATDFDPASNYIYTVAASGIIFRGNYDGSGWTALNDDENFNNYVLQVVGGGDRRLVAAKGKKLWYSDNEGADWKQASGFSFYDNWGGPLQLIELNNNELYYLVQTWIANPWGSGYHLYRSTNRGENWTLVQAFTARDWRRVALWSPYRTKDLYVLDNGQKMYKANADSLTLLHDITGLPLANAMWMTGSNASGSTKMYVLAENKEVYSSEDEGKTWNLQSTLAPPAWGETGIVASPFVADALYYGEVNMYKSDDGGISWNLQNEWWEYYGNTDFLHADIMSFTPATTKDSVDFFLIGNHGGMHRTTDNFITTVNIGTLNLNVGQYYEHATGFDNGQEYMFVGSQDQGMQRVSTANGTGQEGATQIISGDYVEMAMCNNGKSLFQEYPFGDFSYYNNPFTATWINSSFKVHGEWGKNIQLWSVPMSTVANPNENAVIVGGGAVNTVDSGSYLIKLTADTDAPFNIFEYQYDFNFRINANTGDSYITAVAQSPVNPSYYFVAMADGTFFYSHDDGTNWNKADGFVSPGNGWLYGSSICVSQRNENQLFLGGNGYGGTGVYQSSDGGLSFKAMVSGLPQTFINDLALNRDETLLFAATEAGPYVCLLNTGKWYPLIGENTPIQPYQSVEYIAATSTVRFCTYGRGVWDFVLKSQPLKVTQFDAGTSNIRVYPTVLSSGSPLYINTNDASGLTLSLFDLTGKMVWTSDWTRQPVLPQLKSGTYLYRIGGNKKSSGKLLVVN